MHYPTNQLKKAYDSALSEYERDISVWHKSSVLRKYGQFTLNLWGGTDKMHIDLTHYGTWILGLTVDRDDKSVCIDRIGGWSNTDRDNMNGLLNILGQPNAFYIRDYCLRCDYEDRVHPSGIIWGPVFKEAVPCQ